MPSFLDIPRSDGTRISRRRPRPQPAATTTSSNTTIQQQHRKTMHSNNNRTSTVTGADLPPIAELDQQRNTRTLRCDSSMWSSRNVASPQSPRNRHAGIHHAAEHPNVCLCESPTSNASWDDENLLHTSSSPTARYGKGRLPIQMLSLSKKERHHRGYASSKWCNTACCTRGSNGRNMGKILLSFAAGAWFALAVLSKHAFQHVLSGDFFDIPLSLSATHKHNDQPMPHKGRIIRINKALSSTRRPFGYKLTRPVQLYPAEYSDITQTYPELDSADIDSEDDSQMEMKLFPQHESDADCVPISEWQTTFHPTCSMFHETDMSVALQTSEMSLISAKGNWRDAWELWDMPQSGWSKIVGGHEDTVVLKTFKYKHDMQDAFFEFNRVDAISMERLTASPYVMSIYGFCGMSVVTAFAGETVTEIVDSINPLGKLFMARLIAKGLSDIHGIDGGAENVTLVHNDINYANIMVGGPRRLPRFNDFNLAVLQMRNRVTGENCPFTHHFPNPQWRSYEEQVGPDGVTKQLSEKIDVYALGNIYYRFVVGKGPWKTAPWRTEYERNSAGEIDPFKITQDDKLRIARVKREEGALPPIPDLIKEKIKKDPALNALYKAMKKCYKFDPAERPSAKELVDYIDLQLDKLDPEKKGS